LLELTVLWLKCRVQEFVILPPDKAGARSALLGARRALTADHLAEASRLVVLHLLRLVRATAPTVIAAYSPFGTEPGGTLPATLAETAPGTEILLPQMLPDRDLDWVRFPTRERLGVDAIRRADLVVVPALSVDRRGYRLGRGGGSYDRALARVNPRALVVALLHDGELAEAVPAEPHDMPVSAVIMPSTGYVALPTGGL
jgi:5-formyltetrahydrofolate cyclo-ligase